MIKFTMKLQDGTKQKISSKSSWNELNYNDLIKIENESSLNPLSLFSILTGVKFDEVANSKDEKLIQILSDVTGFIYKTPDWKDIPCPDKILIGDKLYKVPTDINDITIGQKILLSQLVSNKNLIEIIPRAVAIMMIKPILGKLNPETFEEIDQVEQKILKSSALQIYGAGQYFFLNSPILSSIGKQSLIMYQKSQRKTGSLN